MTRVRRSCCYRRRRSRRRCVCAFVSPRLPLFASRRTFGRLYYHYPAVYAQTTVARSHATGMLWGRGLHELLLRVEIGIFRRPHNANRAERHTVEFRGRTRRFADEAVEKNRSALFTDIKRVEKKTLASPRKRGRNIRRTKTRKKYLLGLVKTSFSMINPIKRFE